MAWYKANTAFMYRQLSPPAPVPSGAAQQSLHLVQWKSLPMLTEERGDGSDLQLWLLGKGHASQQPPSCTLRSVFIGLDSPKDR